MAFNVMARNLDDHTTNFSFLHKQGGSWDLSPAYDINFAHDPTETYGHQHFLAVNGRHDGITRHDLLQEAKRFSIAGAKAILAEVRAAVERWNEFSEKAGLPQETNKGIQRNHKVA
jgi:serine/threonine-protein kinase HipA